MTRPNQKPDLSTETDCIWMQAGVVQRKNCRIEYACNTCRFDRALHRQAEINHRARRQGEATPGRRGRIKDWKEQLMTLPAAQRPCVHHLKKRIDFKACPLAYYCATCEFDQYFSDQFTVYARLQQVELMDIKGVSIPQGYYLHSGHCWLKVEEGQTVRIGLDDFAARLLGPPDRVHPPLLGQRVEANQPGPVLERDNRHAVLISPVSGVVTAVNPVYFDESPPPPSTDPYENGWLLVVQCDDLRKDLANLMISGESEAYLSDEVDRLFDLIEETAGPLAADGGTLGPDVYGSMPELGWEKINDLFLNPSD